MGRIKNRQGRKKNAMERRTKILALVGKGGVGKTTICSAFVRILSEKYPEARILAIGRPELNR